MTSNEESLFFRVGFHDETGALCRPVMVARSGR
jgi:hypothetical protein